MLVTNEKFLKHVASKKLVVAFDISGAHPKYVPTMHGLFNNCTRRSRMPIMLTFDTHTKDVSVTMNSEHSRMGGTDIEQCMTYIKVLDKPDVVLYITDGMVCWPKENILLGIEQYVHLLSDTSELVPNYITII